MILDYFAITLRTLSASRGRSWLTVIGILLGVIAVVSLVSLGQGLQDEMNRQFEALGSDKMFVYGGQGTTGWVAGSGIRFTDDDLDAVKSTRGVALAGGMSFKVAPVEFKDEMKYTFVIGIADDPSRDMFMEASTFVMQQGRDLREGDTKKALIGPMLMEGHFFSEKVKLRDKIVINGEEFQVIGVWEPIGNPQDDSQVIISLKEANELFGQTEYDYLMIQVETGFGPADVAERVKDTLRDVRDVKEGEEDFTVMTMDQMMEMTSTVMAVMSAVVISLAAISLLVGGVGIMNTMYTSVMERRKYIGIMKAVGASDRDVLTLFLIESGLLGVGGGIMGVLIGVGIAKGFEWVAATYLFTSMLKAHVSLELVAAALLFSFTAGAVAGLLPARQAARMNPVDALRGEA